MIRVNLDKAKAIAHDIRRVWRAEEFKPYDEAIALRIPGQIAGAEAKRKEIREKYEIIQTAIGAATSAENVKAILADWEPKK